MWWYRRTYHEVRKVWVVAVAAGTVVGQWGVGVGGACVGLCGWAWCLCSLVGAFVFVAGLVWWVVSGVLGAAWGVRTGASEVARTLW
jgi:hypothetical protein